MEKIELDNILKLVDEFIASLKKELLSVEVPSRGILPGVWDKMKSWWYNLTKKKGPNDLENPYVYKNKFGALGQTQESKRLSLSQYSFIKEQYTDLENNLNILSEETTEDSENIKKLKLFKIIDSWADRFKKAIISQFNDKPVTNRPIAPPVASSGETGTVVGLDDEAAAPGNTRSITTPPVARPVADKVDSGGAGRTSPFLIRWSDEKSKFFIRKKIEGKAKAVVFPNLKLLPINELKTKDKKEIEKLEASAENYIKLEIYTKLVTQLPGTNRAATGIEGQPLFEIDSEKFDRNFEDIFKTVIEKYSLELKGRTKDEIKRINKNKEIVRKIYKEIDEMFFDRGESYSTEDLNKFVTAVLGDIPAKK
jgi:hypothetical protein